MHIAFSANTEMCTEITHGMRQTQRPAQNARARLSPLPILASRGNLGGESGLLLRNHAAGATLRHKEWASGIPLQCWSVGPRKKLGAVLAQGPLGAEGVEERLRSVRLFLIAGHEMQLDRSLSDRWSQEVGGPGRGSHMLLHGFLEEGGVEFSQVRLQRPNRVIRGRRVL